MTKSVHVDGTLEHWRAHARWLLQEGVPPQAVDWHDPTRQPPKPPGLFDHAEAATPAPRAPAASSASSLPGPRLPASFVRRLATVACHAGDGLWPLLYRIVWRMTRPDAAEALTEDEVLDPDMVAFARLEKAVRRDAHKMHAFVRFRRIDSPEDPGGERFVAWYRPQHFIVEREAAFFRDRFPEMAWSILTPFRSVHWDGRELQFTAGAPADAAPAPEEIEALWITYYGAIFNPARIKLAAMQAEMPKRHWDTLPETASIPALLAEAPRRLAEMAKHAGSVAESAAPYVPGSRDLATLRAALADCHGCELCDNGTRPVFGEGSASASLALVGEQPGDQEERRGRPFVGPAGQLLDEVLHEAGLEREALYVTNAVKHFAHRVVQSAHGKRRLHARPRYRIVSQCQPWLDAELDAVRPEVVVCLGSTAARAVFGPTFRLREERGAVRETRYARATLATHHPAALLRTESDELRKALRAELVADLRRAAACRGTEGQPP